MKIRITGDYEFQDYSDCNSENGMLSVLYEVPNSWTKWSVEKKEEWLHKNENKIQKHFRDSMYVAASINLDHILEEDEF